MPTLNLHREVFAWHDERQKDWGLCTSTYKTERPNGPNSSWTLLCPRQWNKWESLYPTTSPTWVPKTHTLLLHVIQDECPRQDQVLQHVFYWPKGYYYIVLKLAARWLEVWFDSEQIFKWRAIKKWSENWLNWMVI